MHTCQIWDCSDVSLIDHSNGRLLLVIWFAHFYNFFATLWKSCSSSINPCVDFSWTYNQMVDTQDRGEHKHNFAWKKIIVFYQNLAKLRLKNDAGFFLKGGSTKKKVKY